MKKAVKRQTKPSVQTVAPLKKSLLQQKKKRERRRKLWTIAGLSTVIVVLILCLVLVGLEDVIRGYLRKINILDPNATEETLALGDTLPPESGIELVSTEELTDSPSQEIDDVMQEIEVMMSQYQAEKNTEAIVPGETEAPTLSPDLEDDVLNILLIGIDSRTNSAKGRSDAMIILTINRNTKKISMTSLMRDIYVGIEGRDPNRLNAAHSYGGADLLLQTIEINFGIKIDYFVRVNFMTFLWGIDAIGGIDVEVDEEELYWVNGYLNEINGLLGLHADTYKLTPDQTGMQHLNGPQALAYARIRYVGSDYARTGRQREVILAAISNLKKLSLSELDYTLDTVLPMITTNMQEDLMMDLIKSVPVFLTYDIVENRIPVAGTYSNMNIDGMSVIRIDFAANRKALRDFIYE